MITLRGSIGMIYYSARVASSNFIMVYGPVAMRILGSGCVRLQGVDEVRCYVKERPKQPMRSD
jgi:hypothetical protein